jgi:hypothetical protein
MWHSCARHEIDGHFQGKAPEVQRVFEQLRGFVETLGPVTVYAQKTRIVFQARARFAGAVPRKNWLSCGFWLKHRAEHPLIHKVELIPPRDYIHHFRLKNWDEFDGALRALLREAYRVGCQETPRAGSPSL